MASILAQTHARMDCGSTTWSHYGKGKTVFSPESYRHYGLACCSSYIASTGDDGTGTYRNHRTLRVRPSASFHPFRRNHHGGRLERVPNGSSSVYRLNTTMQSLSNVVSYTV